MDKKNVETNIDNKRNKVGSDNQQNEKKSGNTEPKKRKNFLREILEPQQLTSSARIGGWYISIVIGILSVLWIILSIVRGIFDPTDQWFALVTVAMPTLAVVISCFILRKVQIGKGDKLIKNIMGLNFVIYFIVVLFTNITSITVWLTYAAAFVPVFIISFLFFRKIERKAIAIEDIHGNIIDFKTTKFAEGITDATFKKFLISLDLGNIDYFFGVHFNGKITDKRIKPITEYMIAFDTEQVYMFEVYGKSISHLTIIPRDEITLTHKVDMKNKRRIELNPSLLEITFDQKGFEHQEEMLDRFMDMFIS